MNTFKKAEDQNKTESEQFRIVRGKNGLKGLTNYSGKLVVDFRFRFFDEFECGRAKVILGTGDNTKRGYLSLDGNVTRLNKPYSEVYSFSEDLAIVHRFYGFDKQLYGFIDNHLNEVIPVKFYGARSFKSGLAAVCNDKYMWGFIDVKGNLVIPFKYDEVGDFIDGLAYVKIGDHPKYKCGFVNINGEEVIPLIYDNAKSFSEGLSTVEKINDKGYSLYGYTDTKGNFKISLQFQEANSFSEGIAAVSLNSYNYFLIDKEGKQISQEFKCRWISSFKNGFAKIDISNGEESKQGIIDKRGKIILEPKYSRIWDEDGDCFIAEESYKCNLFDKHGNKLTPNYYDEIFSFVEGFAVVRKYPFIYGLINKKGEEIVPCIYEDIAEFRDGIAAVKLNGKWGYINKDGLISRIEYDDICLYNNDDGIFSISHYNKILELLEYFPKNLRFFEEDIGYVKKDSKYGIVDLNGIEIAPCIYEFFRPSTKVEGNNLIGFKRNGRYGFLNTRGREICDPIYSNILNFSDGLAACCKDGKWGFINEIGDVIIPFKYFCVGSFNFGLASVDIDNLWGYINKLDIVVIKPQFLVAEAFSIRNSNGDILAKVQKWDGKSSCNDGYLIDKKGKLVEKIY